MIIDGHADISGYLIRQKQQGRLSALEDDLLADLQAGGITGVVNAVYLSEDELADPKKSALAQIKEIKHQVELSQRMELVTSAHQFEAAYKRDLIGLFLSLEGAEPIEQSSDLDLYYDQGVRFVGLTWNRANRYSGGCATPEIGLSDSGRELLDRMSQKNMILDLSHLSDVATDQALAYYRGTVIASHSNARSYADHVRNMTDDQLIKLANRGGVVGLNAMSKFVSQNHATKEDMRRQLDYMINLCGEDHVAFGFDFCDRLFPEADSKSFDVLDGHEQAFDFLDTLRLPDRIKDKLAWQNWLRIYETLNDKPSA